MCLRGEWGGGWTDGYFHSTSHLSTRVIFFLTFCCPLHLLCVVGAVATAFRLGKVSAASLQFFCRPCCATTACIFYHSCFLAGRSWSISYLPVLPRWNVSQISLKFQLMPESAKLFAGEVVMDKHAKEAPDLEPHQEIECSELTKQSTRKKSTSKELAAQRPFAPAISTNCPATGCELTQSRTPLVTESSNYIHIRRYTGI